MGKTGNASALSRHLDVSREQLRRLVANGVLEKRDDGFDLDDSRLRYIRFLRERPTRSAARDRLIAAQTKLNEQRLAERQHELIRLDEFNAAWDTCFGLM